MSRRPRSVARAVAVALLAFALQSWSSCRVKSDTDGDDDGQNGGGGRTLTALLPVHVAPWVGPIFAPIPLRVRE